MNSEVQTMLSVCKLKLLKPSWSIINHY